MIEPGQSLPPVCDADETGDDDGGRHGSQDEAQHEADSPGEAHHEAGENGHGGRFNKAEIRRKSIIGEPGLVCSSILSSSRVFTFPS